MLVSAKLSRRSCAIDERKYDFMSLGFEKLRSALETAVYKTEHTPFQVSHLHYINVNVLLSDDSSIE